MHIHTHTHVHAHMQPYTHANTHTHTHARAHTQHTYTTTHNTRTHNNTHKHASTHTNTHTCVLYYAFSMRSILYLLHDSKMHASNTLCTARESVFLCAACKLTAILCERRIKAYNEMALAKRDKILV